ncbi:hypothetical protein Acr_07g0011460 [Actinidia rufa]|uniref:Uncharacterized protein n=1 Tax=Actinidia rufa TaxID=165716 RepID=A0A7J0EX31_9ERIC|nr:hypothetical protein Acr_07g0011460 [Actinidia rufa]
MQEAHRNLDMRDSVVGKTSLSHSLGHVRDASSELAGNPAGEDQYYCCGPMKEIGTGGKELVNRVKWLKGILEFGVPLSNAGRPPWRFWEHRASSTPK